MSEREVDDEELLLILAVAEPAAQLTRFDHAAHRLAAGHATIVRIVLVPATMRLLGDWNWWLPRWLDRWLPSLDLEGGTGLPEPEYEPGHGPLTPAARTDSSRHEWNLPV